MCRRATLRRKPPVGVFGPGRLLPILGLLLCAAWGLFPGCATYRQDLARARAHYDKNEYEPALALLRVLETDTDSLNRAEQTQYAYTRGMTDYRLASLASEGTGVNNPKQGFRSNARHWLGVARAMEKESPGGLRDEEKERLEDALKDLNQDVFGGAEPVGADGGVPKAK